MPTPYPKEFRADVVAVARRGEQSRAQVARAFGISESCLARWLRIADRDDGLEEYPDDPQRQLATESIYGAVYDPTCWLARERPAPSNA